MGSGCNYKSVIFVGTKGTRAAAAPSPKWPCHDLLDLWHQREREETSSALLLQKLGIEDITTVLQCRRLRWYDKVQRAPRPVWKLSQTFRFPALERKEGPGRHGLNVWRLMPMSGLAGLDLLDRDAWKAGVRHSLTANPIEWDTDSTLI